MTKVGQAWPDGRLAPHGTPAAARRHWRKKEPLCAECLAAARRARSVNAGEQSEDLREKRNNLPDTPRYRYRARRYPLAERALALAEAVHGRPPNEAT